MSTKPWRGKGGGAGKQDGAEGSLAQEESWPADPSGDRRVPGEHPSEPRRISVLPLWWRMTHSSRWVARVLASELSLVAFILLLAMVFSKKWLCLSGSRVYQRWPTNVSARICTSARLMSMGLLHICKSKSCSSSENGKVTFIFSTLLLFPINLWIFEWKRNLSVPIGWSYFIGWPVFVLYVTCAALRHFNHKHFWSVIMNCPSRAASCSSGASSVQNFPSEPGVSHASVKQEEVLDPERKKASP
uniref:Outer dense fiber of sperm tails 4 n=1 Tax=Lynx canadensis TaxID=61383 RepID=A0A667H1X2_LYNCA